MKLRIYFLLPHIHSSVCADRAWSHSCKSTLGICKFVPHTNATWKTTPLSLVTEHEVCSDLLLKPTVETVIFSEAPQQRLKDFNTLIFKSSEWAGGEPPYYFWNRMGGEPYYYFLHLLSDYYVLSNVCIFYYLIPTTILEKIIIIPISLVIGTRTEYLDPNSSSATYQIMSGKLLNQGFSVPLL